MLKGWFHRPGIQDGARTLEEQLRGLDEMLAECSGRRVLDLGCAEGLIARACLERGALDVTGIDVIEEHIRAANGMDLNQDRASFSIGDLNGTPAQCGVWVARQIVLMLAILHKLRAPEQSLCEWAQVVAPGGLLVIRLPVGSTGVVRHKHGRATCDTRQVLPELGFAFERDNEGPRGERVHYWRRAA